MAALMIFNTNESFFYQRYVYTYVQYIKRKNNAFTLQQLHFVFIKMCYTTIVNLLINVNK